MKKKILSTIAKLPLIALGTALFAMLLLNLFTLWSVDEIRKGRFAASGYFCAIVGSGSMEPAVFVNDLLLVKGESAYQVQDVITYVSSRGGLVTHRVKEVLENGYITQGDANNIPDEAISAQQVLGRVIFTVPGVGAVMEGILSPAGIGLLGSICLLLYLIQRVRRKNDDEGDKTEHSFENAPKN